MPRARPAVLAVCAFVLGVLFVWVGFRPDDPISFCPGPGTAVEAEAQLWPPGTLRCDNGRTYVPVREWLTVACLAAAVGFAAARRLVAAALLVVAAFAAFFV